MAFFRSFPRFRQQIRAYSENLVSVSNRRFRILIKDSLLAVGAAGGFYWSTTTDTAFRVWITGRSDDAEDG